MAQDFWFVLLLVKLAGLGASLCLKVLQNLGDIPQEPTWGPGNMPKDPTVRGLETSLKVFQSLGHS